MSTRKNKPPRTRKPAASKVKAKPGRGRPTLYKVEYCAQVEKLCKLGATDKEIADFFGVAESTINEWKLVYPEFSESIKKGKIIADAKVAAALFERAIGYSHPDSHISSHQGEVTVTPITKHYPPDTGAAFIWLKNRQPDKWRDRVEADVTVSGMGELAGVYEEAMRRARERQAAVLAARGISLPGADEE